MQAEEARYEPFNDKFVILYGDKSQYEAIVQGTLQGKWYKRLKAFLIPKNNEERLEALLRSLANSAKFDEMASRIKTRRGQKKYHREISGDEYSSESDEESPILNLRTSTITPRRKSQEDVSRRLRNSRRVRQREKCPTKSKKKPRSRQRLRKEKNPAMVSEDLLLASESSDTSDESSSDSDFPEAEDPRDIEKEHKTHLSRMKRMKKRDVLVKRN
jgi:hypothetical protein